MVGKAIHSAYLLDAHDDRCTTPDLCLCLFRSDTTSTNHTEDDLPGAGRSIDKLYQHGGRIVERTINSIAKAVSKPKSRSTKRVANKQDDDNANQDELALVRVDTASTNETCDDLPGPGRGLDKLYQLIGRRIERVIGQYADRLGYGPAAVERTVLAAFEEMRLTAYLYQTWTPPAERHALRMRMKKAELNAHKQFRRLIGHITSPVPSTQLRALHVLAKVKECNPVYADVMYNSYRKENVGDLVENVLHRVRFIAEANVYSGHMRAKMWRHFYVDKLNQGDLDALLAQSHRALVCVEENELNCAAKTLYGLRFARSKSVERLDLFERNVHVLARFITHPRFAPVAMRYMGELYLTQMSSYEFKIGGDIRWQWRSWSMILENMASLAQCFCDDGYLIPEVDAVKSALLFLPWEEDESPSPDTTNINKLHVSDLDLDIGLLRCLMNGAVNFMLLDVSDWYIRTFGPYERLRKLKGRLNEILQTRKPGDHISQPVSSMLEIPEGVYCHLHRCMPDPDNREDTETAQALLRAFLGMSNDRDDM